MNQRGLHVLVTGGAGFIGSHLVEYHLSKGDKIQVVDDLSTGSLDNLAPFVDNPDFRFEQADVLLWPGLQKAAAWADRIYHMAAMVGVFRVLEDPIKVLSTNASGTERILRAAASGNWNPQIIIASTSEIYGKGYHCNRMPDGSPASPAERELAFEDIPAFREDMEPLVGSSAVSRWNYPISKLVDEAFGISYANKFNMKVTVIRLFNTIGPRQTGRYGMVAPRFVRQAVANDTMKVFGDGTQSRSFCDVRDTVRALDIVAANPESWGQIVNVGNAREISICDLAELVRERTKSKSKIEFVPYSEAYGADFAETMRRRPCLKKFFHLTDFEHEWTLERTLDDLIQREKRDRARSKGEHHGDNPVFCSEPQHAG